MRNLQPARLRPGRRSLAALVLVLCLLGLAAAVPAPPTAEPANPVLDWSQIAENAITVGRPPASSEVLGAIVQVAVYDTVIALHGGARPYAVRPKVTRPASTAAAVATAAHHLLAARVPTQARAVDAAYAGYLAGIPAGPARTNGIDLGARVAAAILALRADDGYDNQVPYVQSPPGPGVFEPVAPTAPVDTKLAQVRPLTYHSPARFRPGGPPRLTRRPTPATSTRSKPWAGPTAPSAPPPRPRRPCSGPRTPSSSGAATSVPLPGPATLASATAPGC